MGTTSVLTYNPTEPVAKRVLLIKRIMDIMISIILLFIFLPLILIIATAHFLFSKGPLFTKHIRVGKSGRRFYLYRFRTMYVDASKRKASNKSVYSPIGRVLKFTHLDGMPQIINVLSNEMSLVGVKPVTLQEFLDMTSDERALYSFKPGVIGSWTISKSLAYGSYSDESIVSSVIVALMVIIKFIALRSLRYRWYKSFEAEIYAQCGELYAESIPLVYERSGDVPVHNLFYDSFKRFADIVISFLAIMLLSPIFLILMVLVIADDGGVPFYSHSRIGLNGRRIRIFKFRSMKNNAGSAEQLLTPEQLEQYRREFKVDDDPRITRIGSFLRSSSLDELPQLFNVLGGSMSLVGPRPIVEEETKYYGRDIEKLLSIKPGMTGFWQAYARNNAEYKDGKRQKMELYYVEHQSLLLDLRIFFHTFGSVIQKEGAK